MAVEDVRATLVLVAFAPEWTSLVGHVDGAERCDRNGFDIVTGHLSGQAVVLAQSGMSMVNAAMATQLLIDHFAIERVVMAGIAGALDPALAVGDVVVPERWGSFLEIGMGRAAGDTYVLPPLPGASTLPPYGMMIPRNVLAARAGEAAHARRWFEVDQALLAAAASIEGIMTGGNGLSGSAFVDNAAYRDYLAATFAARLVDMESTAVAQVAFANRLPFIAFRAVSDFAGAEPDNGILQAMDLASARCAAAVLAFLAKLPVSGAA